VALYLLKVHLQTFLSVPITQKNVIFFFICGTLVANGRHVHFTDLVTGYIFSNGGVHRKMKTALRYERKNITSCPPPPPELEAYVLITFAAETQTHAQYS